MSEVSGQRILRQATGGEKARVCVQNVTLYLPGLVPENGKTITCYDAKCSSTDKK